MDRSANLSSIWTVSSSGFWIICRIYTGYITVLIYIVDEEKGVYNEDGSINVNPNSLTVIKEAYVEPELEKYDKEDSFQFMRTGYFCLDSKDSTKEHMVFNRIVSLKSSYKPN